MLYIVLLIYVKGTNRKSNGTCFVRNDALTCCPCSMVYSCVHLLNFWPSFDGRVYPLSGGCMYVCSRKTTRDRFCLDHSSDNQFSGKSLNWFLLPDSIWQQAYAKAPSLASPPSLKSVVIWVVMCQSRATHVMIEKAKNKSKKHNSVWQTPSYITNHSCGEIVEVCFYFLLGRGGHVAGKQCKNILSSSDSVVTHGFGQSEWLHVSLFSMASSGAGGLSPWQDQRVTMFRWGELTSRDFFWPHRSKRRWPSIWRWVCDRRSIESSVWHVVRWYCF